MSTFDSGSSRDPLDPDFAGLFRPQEDLPAAPAGAGSDEGVGAEAGAEVSAEDSAEDSAEAGAEADESAAPDPEPAADTGRLFRSQGVQGRDEAVLALASDHAGRLRTLTRLDAHVRPDARPVQDESTRQPVADAAEPAAADSPGRRRLRREPGHRTRGITGGAVYLIVIGVTLLVAFANVLISGGKVGWLTGLALVASSVYSALTVRREDDTVAIIVPPVAFLVAALTAGQLFIGSTEGSLLNRGVVAFFTLADNWIWIIGATAAALVIVLVRRRRE